MDFPLLNMNVRVVTGSFRVDTLLTQWTDRMHFDFDPAETLGTINPLDPTDQERVGSNWLYESFAQIDAIPTIGDKHPRVKNCYCCSVEVNPAPGSTGPSPTSIEALVGWHFPTEDSQIIEADVYQSQEIANYDKDGNPTRVYYKAKDPQGNDTTIFPKSRIADIRLPKLIKSFRIIQYEDLSDRFDDKTTFTLADVLGLGSEHPLQAQKQGDHSPRPFYNKDRAWGFDPNTVLFIGRKAVNNGTPLYRCEYDFLVNERGWNKWYAVYTNQQGIIPQDVLNFPKDYLKSQTDPPADKDLQNTTKFNGIGIFDMLEGGDFDDIFQNINLPNQ